MMNNVTNAASLATSFFRQHLLGESLKNILIRLTIILSAIIVVWSGIMLALIIHTKCQRSKQMLKKPSIPHHHLHDSNTSLNRKRPSHPKRIRHFNLSSCCYYIVNFLSRLKRHCLQCSSLSSSTSIDNETSKIHSSPNVESKQQGGLAVKDSRSGSNKVHLVVEAMTRKSSSRIYNAVKIKKKGSLYRETESSSGDELKTFYPYECDQKLPIIISSTTSDNVQIESKGCVHHPSIPLLYNETTDERATIERLHTSHKVDTKVTLSLNPITRRLSNTNTNTNPSCLLANITQIPQSQHKPFLLLPTAGEPKSKNDIKRRHSLLDDPTRTGSSEVSSPKHIPLVMITDTSSSNTNIVELETFEDKCRVIGDVEKRLSLELRAAYRPRHST